MNGGMKDAVNLAWKLALVVAGKATEEILDTYEVERAQSVRAMVNVSRRLGAVIMPTNQSVAGIRDAAFALLNLSRGFRSFVQRGGVLPPPHISRSALTGQGRDSVVGQMLPQPDISAANDIQPLDRWLGCHQWLALGIGIDPALALSVRDRAILQSLGARLIAVNAANTEASTLRAQCDDQGFLDWTKRYRIRGVLVRPDRFIAERLDPRSDLRSLDPFGGAAAAHNATAAQSPITATAA
jgi:3-(3-hydroxy-phenyl)propionate hydroxylase